MFILQDYVSVAILNVFLGVYPPLYLAMTFVVDLEEGLPFLLPSNVACNAHKLQNQEMCT
jgi:hypothetical protein